MPSMSWDIFDAAADRYERWYATPKGQRVGREEQALISWLLQQVPVADRVVEIGCGTGHFIEWLRGRGTQAFGLDRSPDRTPLPCWATLFSCRCGAGPWTRSCS
jgi:SAM-dependent methyltransferase